MLVTIRKQTRKYAFKSVLTAALGTAVLSCTGADQQGTSRSQSGTKSGANSTSTAEFVPIGASLDGTESGLKLADDGDFGSEKFTYKAKVSGGINCFGDLYANGTGEITVNGLGKVMDGSDTMFRIRKYARLNHNDEPRCTITMLEFTMNDVKYIGSQGGLQFRKGGIQYFTKENQTEDKKAFYKVSVASVTDMPEKSTSTSDSPPPSKIEVKLVGEQATKEDAVMYNAEIFVVTSGKAYEAPAVSLDLAEYFNGKFYFKFKCTSGFKGNDNCDNQSIDELSAGILATDPSSDYQAISAAFGNSSHTLKYFAVGKTRDNLAGVWSHESGAMNDQPTGIDKPAGSKTGDTVWLVLRRAKKDANDPNLTAYTFKVFKLSQIK